MPMMLFIGGPYDGRRLDIPEDVDAKEVGYKDSATTFATRTYRRFIVASAAPVFIDEGITGNQDSIEFAIIHDLVNNYLPGIIRSPNAIWKPDGA